MSTYIKYSAVNASIPTYTTLSALPTLSYNGALALTLDTDNIYVFNTGSATWIEIAGPNSALSMGTFDSGTPSAAGAHIDSGHLVMQSATATVPGSVNISTQTFAGNKTFTGTIGASNLSGTNTGDVTLTAVGSSPSANAASLSGQALTLQPADSSHPGVVTTSAQTFSGDKTLSGTTTSKSTGNTPSLTIDTSDTLTSADIFQVSNVGLLRKFLYVDSNTTTYIKANINDSPSLIVNSSDYLDTANVFDFQIGGGSEFTMDAFGDLTAQGSLQIGGSFGCSGIFSTGSVMTTQIEDLSGHAAVYITGKALQDNSANDMLLWADASADVLVTGVADKVKLLVKGYATQTSDILEVQKSDNTVLFSVNNSGNAVATGTIGASNFSGTSSGTNTGNISLTAVGSSPSANGASLSGQALTLQPADGTQPGLITAGTQTIGGAKTFSGGVTATVTGTASGNTTYTANNHGVVLSSATNAMTVLAPDASATKVLKSGGSSADPSWLSYDNANTVSTLVFRDSSGNFSAGTITAALTGNATTATSATTATTATNATNVATTSTSTSASFFPLFVASSSNGNQAASLGTGLTFNPSTNNLSTTTFTGALTGAASGNTSYTANNHGVVLSGSANTMTVIAPDASTAKTLISGGSSADPAWGTLAIGGGGTGQTSKAAAFDALSPMSASGDIIYGGTSGTGTRLGKGSNFQYLALASGIPAWAAAEEIFISSAQTADGTTTSATYADFTNNISLTFTPNKTGTYLIICFPFVKISTNANGRIELLNSAGSATVNFNSTGYITSPLAGQNIMQLTLFQHVTLTSGTSYTFKTQGKTDAGTITLYNSITDNGQVMMAMSVN